jgi:hypothetical protein
MSIQENVRQPRTVALICPACGQAGTALWEGSGSDRQLVRLDGFFERLARKEPYPIETVCNNCGKAQRG